MPIFRIHTNAGVFNVDGKNAKAARITFAKKMPSAFISKIKLACNANVTEDKDSEKESEENITE